MFTCQLHPERLSHLSYAQFLPPDRRAMHHLPTLLLHLEAPTSTAKRCYAQESETKHSACTKTLSTLCITPCFAAQGRGLTCCVNLLLRSSLSWLGPSKGGSMALADSRASWSRRKNRAKHLGCTLIGLAGGRGGRGGCNSALVH